MNVRRITRSLPRISLSPKLYRSFGCACKEPSVEPDAVGSPSSRNPASSGNTSASSKPIIQDPSVPFDTRMLELIRCPLTKNPLRWDTNHQALISDEINVAYPVRNGVPILIPQDARILESC